MTKQPLVIGVGGLLEQGESGRIQEMLQAMKDKGCIVYAPRFRTICKDGNKIICPVNGNWIDDIGLVVREALMDETVDQNRVGFIASSLGATFLDYFLATDETLSDKLKPYVSIVPFAKPHPAIKPYVQRMIDGKVDLDVSFPHDREKGITRIIPSRCLETVLDIDVPQALLNRKTPYSINPLTILGVKEDRCDNIATKLRHEIFSGKPENIIELAEYGHSIPQEAIQERVLEFMYKGLGIN
ncbi:hypothetical protein J4423_00470 [Candidatus Pacearchaeota archaeon]|nr:hypothetical protein [Candidatus Pacearchaeota archaeon]